MEWTVTKLKVLSLFRSGALSFENLREISRHISEISRLCTWTRCRSLRRCGTSFGARARWSGLRRWPQVPYQHTRRPWTSTGVSKGVVMRLRRMASTGEQVLERGAVWGTLGELYHSYFLEILYNFGFPRGGLRCDPPWRSWFSPCPIGPKIFF